MIRGRPTQSRVSRLAVPVGNGDHVRGRPDAPVTLVEYGDFECPFCKAAYPIVEQVRERFGPRLRFVYRHFPMATMHPHARGAARATEAAAGQHPAAFWAMHDLLYEHRGPPDEETLLDVARSLGLSTDRLRADMDSETVDRAVQEDFVGGARSGVNGTPTFYVDGIRYDGPHTASMLGAAIQERLSGG